MQTRFIYLACDLQDDEQLIERYKAYHAPGSAWPEITESIKRAGIVDMKIYNFSNRLFMIMEVDETFHPETKSNMDKNDPKVQEWESLMWEFQKAIPGSPEGVKWVTLEKIFQLQ